MTVKPQSFIIYDTILCQSENICSTNLNGGRAEGKQLISGSLGVSIHVDQNVDSILVNTISCLAIARNLEERRTSFSKNSHIIKGPVNYI